MRCRYTHTDAAADDDGDGGGNDDGGGTHAFAAKPAELINSATDTELLLLLPLAGLAAAARSAYASAFLCMRVYRIGDAGR